jgi:hypothetical protein
MSPDKQRLLTTGLVPGLGCGVGSHLMFLLKEHEPEYLASLIVCAVHLGIALPGLLFRREAQVRWYRRALVIPVSCVCPAFLLASGLESGSLFVVAVWGALVVLPLAPLVWLVGALYVSTPIREGPGRVN